MSGLVEQRLKRRIAIQCVFVTFYSILKRHSELTTTTVSTGLKSGPLAQPPRVNAVIETARIVFFSFLIPLTIKILYYVLFIVTT